MAAIVPYKASRFHKIIGCAVAASPVSHTYVKLVLGCDRASESQASTLIDSNWHFVSIRNQPFQALSLKCEMSSFTVPYSDPENDGRTMKAS